MRVLLQKYSNNSFQSTRRLIRVPRYTSYYILVNASYLFSKPRATNSWSYRRLGINAMRELRNSWRVNRSHCQSASSLSFYVWACWRKKIPTRSKSKNTAIIFINANCNLARFRSDFIILQFWTLKEICKNSHTLFQASNLTYEWRLTEMFHLFCKKGPRIASEPGCVQRANAKQLKHSG